MGQDHHASPPGPSRRSRSRLAREIALTLALKLVLIVTIKFVFFSEPVKKPEVEERMQAVFSTAPLSARPGIPDDSVRRTHD